MTQFCDGLKEVSILNGIARLEFHRIEPTGREHEFQVASEFVVAMPLSGLIEAMKILDGVRERLIAAGLLNAPETDNLRDQTAGKSPNFVRVRPENSM